MSVFSAQYRVSFGDCDPAGIVFYPNIFAWLDRTFHLFLDKHGGGHAALCERLGARGIGLTEAQCRFRAPVPEGSDFTVEVSNISWEERVVRLTYTGRVREDVAFEGTETRAVFVFRDGRLRMGNIVDLRAAMSV
ncbi:MAG: acyl-CoA thioesterase [Pseudomonadota bacterium]